MNRKAHTACQNCSGRRQNLSSGAFRSEFPFGSRLGQTEKSQNSPSEKFGICRKIRLKSKDFSRIWSECRDSNPRPLGPEGWSDIFSGHFEPFLRLSTRKISQRRPFRHGSFHLIFPRLGHGLGQDRKPAVQKLRRCKQRIGGDVDRGWKGSFVIRLLCWSFAKAPDTAADTVVPPEYPAYCRAICRSCRVA